MITFRDVAVDLSVATIQKVFNAVNSVSSLASLLSPGLVSINSADLNIASGSVVGINIGAQIKNPTKFSLSLGNLDFSLQLDHTTLLSVSLAPMNINAGDSTLALSISTSIQNSVDGSDEKFCTSL